MTEQMENQAMLMKTGSAGKSTAAFTEAQIKSLKGQLEKKKSRSPGAAHWGGMIEDCEIILQHLESTPAALRPQIDTDKHR